MRGVIYLDAAASTPLAPEAYEATVEALRRVGNPGAAHEAGRVSARLVDEARSAVADLLDVGAASVVFTSTATEATNLALRGTSADDGRRGLITTAADHPATLSTVQDLAAQGARSARYVGVGETGEIDLDEVDHAITTGTLLVTIHAANNETGVIQPIEDIVAIAHERGALVHADASQLMAWGQSSVLMDCDLITVSSHKMHGPQGAAALIVKPTARAKLRSQVTGGGQERGLRSGTSNVAAIAGFGAAARLAFETGASLARPTADLRDLLCAGLADGIADVIEHAADARRRLPGIVNLAVGAGHVDSAESEVLLARVPAIAASTGSACHAGAPGPSPVLLAMGISDWEASRSIRFSLSRYTTADEIESAVAALSSGYADLVRFLGGSARPAECTS